MVAALDDPVFLFLVGVMLTVVLLAYLFLRRTMASLREGYDEAYRDGNR
jgi:hypothetical protein